MHERLSVSGLCFPTDDLAASIDRLVEIGAHHTTIQAAKVRAFGWRAGIERLASSGIAVAALVHGQPFDLSLPESWDATRSRVMQTVEAAATLGARAVYLVTGRMLTDRGQAAPWKESAAAFVEAIGPVVAHARSSQVQLAVEPTSTLYADVNIVHTLADALLLLEHVDLGVCLDLFHVWTEPRFEEHIAALADRIALVQVSDQVLGDRSLPCRAVPGDGAVPLTRALQSVLDSGYDGPIDLELSGPRIDAEGHVAAARRAVAWLEAALVELGLPARHHKEN